MRRSALLGLLGLGAAYAALCLAFSAADPDLAFDPRELAGPETLPRGFLWGTATAAHQVEGGNALSDWARWEEVPGHIARGEKSGRAADHWNRVAEDVGLMKALGANAYRFSIEWSRLEPAPGEWDEAAWAHYEDELTQLRSAGIAPMVTLLHFTLPAWLADKGGVLAPGFPERFGRFAAEAAKRLGGLVDLWCTINEPNIQMYFGYVTGAWPPGHESPEEASRAFAALARAHAAAAAELHARDRGSQVGVAMNLMLFDPARRWSLPDWIAARSTAAAFDWAVYDSIAAGRIRFRAPGFPKLDEPLPSLRGSADYLGVNYYSRSLVRFSPRSGGLVETGPGPGPRSDLGWEIYPEGLLRLLRTAWSRYRLPLYVTENGIADAAGTRRARFLRAHAHAVARAVAEGIPVRGYFHWSLLDNFEWAEGFAPRFGLYRVDYATVERTPAPGAEAFAALAPSQASARGSAPPRKP